MWLSLLALTPILASALAQAPSAGIYRITPGDFAQVMLSQQSGNIVVAGGSRIGDAAQQWYITPVNSSVTQVTIQNAGTQQYLSVPGVPANDTAVAPSTEPFVWTINRSGQQGITVDGLYYLTDRVGVVPQKIITGPPSSSAMLWVISAVTPFPATYRLWNPVTDLYLTSPGVVPGIMSARPFDATSGLQVFTLTGTGPGSTYGQLAEVTTGAVVSISNGTIGTWGVSSYTWNIVLGGSGDKLASTSTGQPIGVDENAHVIVTDGGNQAWVFVPASSKVA